MLIRFTRAKDRAGSLHSLTCRRDDGSVTGMKEDEVFVLHDLVHYAVETTFHCRQAFYGLLDSGWDILTFGEINPATGKKREIPDDGLGVEQLVGLLQAELRGTIARQDFRSALEAVYATVPVAITDQRLDQTRSTIAGLLQRWAAVPPGGILELPFPSRNGADSRHHDEGGVNQ